MVNPALAILGLVAVSGATRGLASGWDAYQAWQRANETQRYWDDYRKNTGYSPRYPRRTGSYIDRTGIVLNGLAGVAGSATSIGYGYFGYQGTRYRPMTNYNPYDNGYY